jgi:hypothetical protein
VTLTIAPPDKQSPTGSSAILARRREEPKGDDAMDAFVEEPMDYSGIDGHELAAPEFPDEEWPAGGSGPAGF